MFICTTDGGDTFAFPNVCNTPSPSGVTPIPYTSLGSYEDADSDTCSDKVTIENKEVCTTDTEISSTSSDEAGSSGGLVSGQSSDVAAPLVGSMKVYAEGNAVVRFLDPVQSNGDSANSYGACISPSQTLVMALG
ncbi:MAG TPA: DUF4150 domain-containing protein [Polyangiaceae bacterium]|nr:DUF4150 domain-containing protein [Polyangiaceae bacterium]